MKTKYKKWISENVTQVLGRCAEITLQMQEVFPELTRVRGHYHCLIWGKREHWWLTAPDGEIVDPTVAQFPSLGEYVEHTGPEPTGMCPNCGEYCYDGHTVCSYQCGDEYSKYTVSGVL